MHPQFLFSQLILNLGVHAERARGHCTNNVMENVFPSLILVNGQWAELTPPHHHPHFLWHPYFIQFTFYQASQSDSYILNCTLKWKIYTW